MSTRIARDGRRSHEMATWELDDGEDTPVEEDAVGHASHNMVSSRLDEEGDDVHV